RHVPTSSGTVTPTCDGQTLAGSRPPGDRNVPSACSARMPSAVAIRHPQVRPRNVTDVRSDPVARDQHEPSSTFRQPTPASSPSAVQTLPSSHVAGSHVSDAVVPAQSPLRQTSPCEQALPSSHGAPSDAARQASSPTWNRTEPRSAPRSTEPGPGLQSWTKSAAKLTSSPLGPRTSSEIVNSPAALPHGSRPPSPGVTRCPTASRGTPR